MSIKVVEATPVSINPGLPASSNLYRYWFDGLSTDTKPVNPDPVLGIQGIADNSIFRELDTGKILTYSTANTNPATGNKWWEA